MLLRFGATFGFGSSKSSGSGLTAIVVNECVFDVVPCVVEVTVATAVTAAAAFKLSANAADVLYGTRNTGEKRFFFFVSKHKERECKKKNTKKPKTQKQRCKRGFF